MAQYRVDSDQMQSTMATAQSQIESVRSSNAQLTGTLNGIESEWTGQASAAFQAAVAEWRSAQMTVEDAITNLNTALGRAADHYGTAEADVVRLFA